MNKDSSRVVSFQCSRFFSARGFRFLRRTPRKQTRCVWLKRNHSRAASFSSLTIAANSGRNRKMSHSREEVIAVVRKTFPESAHDRVLELLDTYGVESY